MDIDHHIRAIERLVILSAAKNDARDWRGLVELFSPQAMLVRPNGDEVTGRAAIEQSYAARPPLERTRHVCSNILVSIGAADDDPMMATVTTSVLLYRWESESTAQEGPEGKTLAREATPAKGNGGLPIAKGPFIGTFEDDVVLTPSGTWQIERRIGTLSAKFG